MVKRLKRRVNAVLHRTYVLFAAGLLAGCATTSNGPTYPSSVTIAAMPDKVKALVVSDLTAQGYQLGKDSDFLLVFDRRTKNFAAALLLSSGLYPVVNERMSLTFVPTGKDTQVSVNLAFVTNPGSAVEMLTPISINAAAAADVGPWFVGLPGEISTAKAPAVVGAPAKPKASP